MSHTLKVLAGGLVLLGLFLLGGRMLSASAPALGMAGAVRWFIPVWLVAAAVNMWIGVTRAGYSVAEEAPIFLIVFAVPAAVALLVAWALTR
ncbi:MAG TPA: hypothetical protein VFV65_04980 [Gemmatimonadales bacterium]|jgi:hypothetical protein|nr:hypothetical protein [Gemmatimonadales bacterium]